MIRYIKDISFGLFSLITAFSYAIFMLLQSALGFSIAGGAFAIFSVFVTGGVLLFFIGNMSKMPGAVTRNTLFIVTIIIGLYYLTHLFYGYEHPLYKSHMLAMGVRFLPAVLMGAVMTTRAGTLEKVEKALLPFMLFFTIVLARIVFSVSASSFASETNMEAYRQEETGLGYQQISYYSIYAFGMTLYLMVYGHFGKWVKRAVIACAFLQLYMCIATGGRGALVLGVAMALYYGMKNLNSKTLFQYIILGVFAMIVMSVFFFGDARIEHGLNRLLGFFGDKDAVSDDNRWERWSYAWESFKASPLFGHGIGSVFYEVGFYSHNIFMDLLCEGGLIAPLIFIIILKRFYTKITSLISIDKRYEIFVIIFLCSFVNILFSGYYLSQTAMWLSLSFILNTRLYRQ